MAVIGPFDFRGGYCPGYDFTTLPQGRGYCTVMENTRITGGSAAPRWGHTNVDNTNLGGAVDLVNGLITWKDTANAVLSIVAICDTKVYVADATTYQGGSNINFTNRTGAVAASSLSGLVTFDSLDSILIGSANSASSGVLFKVTAYNANAAALGGSPPSADIVKQVNNFLFISRNLSSATTQSRVYWSNINDPETWGGTDFVDFNANDGEPIMALGSIGTDLYIFKPNSVGRLGTVTLTTSGAVTLGPLVTVSKGVGCCGPRALDNLPNGNIIFLSSDGHLYEFDGSTFLDRSVQPYPGPNAYRSGAYDAASYWNLGLSGFPANTNSSVKVCRGINEVWISFIESLNGATQPGVLAYNFEHNRWEGFIRKGLTDPNDRDVYTLTTFLPNSAWTITPESSECFLWGSSDGNVWISGYSAAPYPADRINLGGSALSTFSVGTVVQLGGEADKFIPRSICFETTSFPQGATASLASLTLYVDFDVYMPNPGTSIYSGSGVLPARIIAPIATKEDAVGTRVFPTFISLLWTGTGPAIGSSVSSVDIIHIGKFWLSDEIIR